MKIGSAAAIVGLVGMTILMSYWFGFGDRWAYLANDRGVDAVNENGGGAVAPADEPAAAIAIEREAFTAGSRAIRLSGAADALVNVEAWLLPCSNEDVDRYSSKRGVHREVLLRAAQRLSRDAAGSFSVPNSDSALLLVARADNAAPAGTIVQVSDAEIDLALPVGSGATIRCFDENLAPLGPVTVVVRYSPFYSHGRDDEDPMADRLARTFFEYRRETKVDGTLVLEHLPSGPLELGAISPGRAEAWTGPVVLGESSDPPFDFYLGPAALLEGTVVDDVTGRPIESVRIELLTSKGRSFYGSAGILSTDERGEFRAEGCWAEFGETSLFAAHPDYAGEQVFIGALKIGEARRVAVRLKPPERFVGRFIDPSGRPIARGRVNACDWTKNFLSFGESFSDADGTFIIDGASRDLPFLLIADASGYAVEFIAVPVPWRQPFEVTLRPLLPVRGKIVAEGYPIHGRVRICRESALLARDWEQSTPVEAATGEFEFKEVPGGSYFFDVLMNDHAPKRFSNIPIARGEPREPLEFSISRGARFSGTIVDDATSQPIAGARIHFGDVNQASRDVYGAMDEIVSVSDERGEFVIENVPLGVRTVLLVGAEGYATAMLDFVLDSPANSAGRELRMKRGGAIEIDIEPPVPDVISQFSFRLVDPLDRHRNGESDDGVGRFEQLPAGSYSLMVRLTTADPKWEGLSRVLRGVVIEEGKTTRVRVSFGGGAVIRGRIAGPGFLDHRGVLSVTAVNDDKTAEFVEIYDEASWGSGEFCLSGVPPGKYTVYAYDGNPEIATRVGQDLVVEEGGEYELEFNLSTRVLRGVVRDMHGLPVVNASVIVRAFPVPGQPRDVWRFSQSDSSGAVAIAGFGSGDVQYLLELDGMARSEGVIEAIDPELSLEHSFLMEPECRLSVGVLTRQGERIDGAHVQLDSNLAIDAEEGLDFVAKDRDSRGRFVVRGTGTSTYVLRVRAPGFFASAATVACVGGSAIDVDVGLRRLVPLHLKILDARGAPLSNQPIRLIDEESKDEVSAWIGDGRLLSSEPTSDDRGECRIEFLPEGKYRVIAPGIDAEVEASRDPKQPRVTLQATGP